MGLRQERLGQTNRESVELVLARVVHGRDQSATALHARPYAFSMSGLQMPDLLQALGFERSRCTFVSGECYVRATSDEFDINRFAEALPRMYADLQSAERNLGLCGIQLPQREGWGFFFGRPSSGRSSGYRFGDGHRGESVKRQEEVRDESFHYVLSWLVSSTGKGWTIHYAPLQRPLSLEVASAFAFFGFEHFDECPEFDFDNCHWRTIAYREEASGGWGNAESTINAFRAHQQKFAPGLAQLLTVDGLARTFGLGLLARIEAPADRTAPPLGGRTRAKVAPGRRFQYDAAVSFAGPQRPLAEALANALVEAGLSVFYDGFYAAQLWGKDLVEFFDDVYRRQSRFCVMFVSSEYCDRMWTVQERRSAQARALEERGREYLLPIRVENVELPGLLPTVGYVSIDEYPIEKIARLLIEKVRAAK